ncbi:MAG: S-formylglutathione hydrolase [Pseudomonadota bacterium]
MQLESENLSFGGRQQRYRHTSSTLDCEMTVSVYLPPQAEAGRVPVLYWLSGLTCTDENFVTKAGAQRAAAAHGIAIVAPDTSPRGDAVPDDPDGAWDFGKGAGFYVDATQPPWSRHYRMDSYVTEELPALVTAALSLDAERASISGHSMGGHGALVLALRNPGHYRSVSAFAPIAAASRCPWGEKALGGYLGDDRSTWQAYDACALIAGGAPLPPTLVDQGAADAFLERELNIPLLEQTLADAGADARVRMQAGYDHSYFFIASFIDEHVAFHAKHLATG